ncbi:MAG: ATP-binding protein [Clostridiales bacterium]|jgi:hypothetical protein|nr:ATP-binding protein [Clostridiales bacterium]
MKELSLHILDIAGNSTAADAALVEITVTEAAAANRLTITVKDDGRGMSAEFLAKVRDPFTTTRTTRGVGLGIPLFERAAVSCGGGLDVTSAEGGGTTVTAWFEYDHIDRQPLGDMPSTLTTLISGNPRVDFVYRHSTDGGAFTLDTRQIKGILGDAPIDTPEVIQWLGGYIAEGLGTL